LNPALLVRQYSGRSQSDSDNATGAVNQQERLDMRLHVQNPQRPYAKHRLVLGGEDMVRSAWRHAEPDRNALALNALSV